MKKIKKPYHLIFLFIVFAELASLFFHFDRLEMFIKPCIMVYVLFLFAKHATQKSNALYVNSLLAFGFSFVGDVLLLFEQINELFFMLGLASFLIAQVIYCIVFFNVEAKTKSGNSLLVPIILTFISGFVIYLILQRHIVGEMKVAVLLYDTALTLMVFFAIRRYKQVSKTSFWYVLIGAILFFISDSSLAINKFVVDFRYSELLVMATYMVAQYFIMLGLLHQQTK